MSGHSKWSTIRRKKEKLDAQRGRVFSRLIKEITVAARQSGGDPESNNRLRTAIASAKAVNMPQQNIDRAIKRGTGELPGVSYEEVTYEGYGPGGVAVLVETLTDNKNRTTSDLRHIFSKHGGSLGSVGCVAWMFDHKSVVTIEGNDYDEEMLLSVAMEAGADDVRVDNGTFEIVTDPANFEALKSELKKNNIAFTSAATTRLPQTTIKLDGKKAEQVLRLMELIEDHDDVQHVFSNFDVPDELIQAMVE